MKNKRKPKKANRASSNSPKITRIKAEKHSVLNEWWKVKKVYIKPLATVLGALAMVVWVLASVL